MATKKQSEWEQYKQLYAYRYKETKQYKEETPQRQKEIDARHEDLWNQRAEARIQQKKESR